MKNPCKHCGSTSVVNPCYFCWVPPEQEIIYIDVQYETLKSNRLRWKQFPSYEVAKKWLDKRGYYSHKVIEHKRSIGVNWNVSRPPRPISYKEMRRNANAGQGQHPGFPDPDLHKQMYFDECDRKEAVRLGISY